MRFVATFSLVLEQPVQDYLLIRHLVVVGGDVERVVQNLHARSLVCGHKGNCGIHKASRIDR